MVPVAPCVKINLYLKLLFVHLNMVRLKGSCSLNSWRNYLPFISNMFTASSLSLYLSKKKKRVSGMKIQFPTFYPSKKRLGKGTMIHLQIMALRFYFGVISSLEVCNT